MEHKQFNSQIIMVSQIPPILNHSVFFLNKVLKNNLTLAILRCNKNNFAKNYHL
jgi:hypothetical protein